MGWACRYGVSWVDPVTKERVPKDSAKVIKAFFAQTIKDEEVA
jgi:beta-glucosidase/6-phospho-beta-glucosidase/beta-galactosidase